MVLGAFVRSLRAVLNNPSSHVLAIRTYVNVPGECIPLYGTPYESVPFTLWRSLYSRVMEILACWAVAWC